MSLFFVSFFGSVYVVLLLEIMGGGTCKGMWGKSYLTSTLHPFLSQGSSHGLSYLPTYFSPSYSPVNLLYSPLSSAVLPFLLLAISPQGNSDQIAKFWLSWAQIYSGETSKELQEILHFSMYSLPTLFFSFPPPIRPHIITFPFSPSSPATHLLSPPFIFSFIYLLNYTLPFSTMGTHNSLHQSPLLHFIITS